MNWDLPNVLFNLAIGHPGFLMLARSIYFHGRSAAWTEAGAPEANVRNTASSIL